VTCAPAGSVSAAQSTAAIAIDVRDPLPLLRASSDATCHNPVVAFQMMRYA
jgi:hypothetical protein